MSLYKKLNRSLFLFGFIIFYNDAIAAEDLPALKINLTISWGEMNKKKTPYFNMTVTNISSELIRALDVRNRRDFIDSFCDVVIIPLNQNFELSRSISDPNIINETDFVDLEPGGILEFSSIILPINYQDLIRGKYMAYGVYRVDPLHRPNEVYKSESIVFEIE